MQFVEIKRHEADRRKVTTIIKEAYSVFFCRKRAGKLFDCTFHSFVNEKCLLIIAGEGVFILNGAVEDSATAEISRSQVSRPVN